MEKKQYTAPKAEILENSFEDIIVASGSPAEPANNGIKLLTDLFG